METATYTAPDISCAHCQAHIEKALAALPGVQKVTIDVPSKKVAVTFDPAQATPAIITATLAAEGYPVEG